jgi:TorA maturation chaperone TorD
MVELLRALAALAEPPSPALLPVVDSLALGPLDAPADYTDLAVLQLPPYASIYLGADGQIGGEARDRIAGFWRALGLEGGTEPDHLTTLLASYAVLLERETSRAEARAIDAARQARHAFFWEHLGSWLPIWLAAVDAIGSPFYRRWATLLNEVMSSEARELGPPVRLPLHLREAPPLPDPRHDGAEAFIAALLAPVRSGIIITRTDLAEAAAAHETGVRKLDRRGVLTSLMADRPLETLGWVACLADGWVSRSALAGLDVVEEFWRARAATTAALARVLADG